MRKSQFSVGANTWSHQGTPIEAVTRIAEAVGAVIQADPTEQTLHILPRYPSAPWDWAAATPDIVLPLDIIESDGIEPTLKAAYNAVYVSGESQGVVGQVKRTGTAGDVVAPMITHPLITHADAARQRGLAILADTGRQARVGQSLPISDATGLVMVGQLAEIPEPGDTWRGLVRGLTVSATWSRTLVVRQRLELERHYLETA